MTERELLDEIFEVASNSDLKASAIRDRISELLVEEGYGGEDDEEDEDD